MASEYVEQRIRVGSSAVMAQAAYRPIEKREISATRLVNFVMTLRRSSKARIAWMSVADGASDAELKALHQRSTDQQLQASRTAAYVALYGGW
jgi:hypothetical protein